MTPHLIFRAHTDLRLGFGHIARALVIHGQWTALGGTSLLAVSGDARARRVASGRHPWLDQSLSMPVVDLGEGLNAPLPQALLDQASVVLVDQWDTLPEQLQALRPAAVAVMEDDTDAHEQADLLFQPYLEGVSWPEVPVRVVEGRKVRPWETFHGGCRVLRGSPFIVISPAAVQLRPKREPIQPLAVHKLLVSFGGTDGPGLAQKAYEILGRMVAEGRWAGTCTLLAPGGVQGGAVPGVTVLPGLPDLSSRIRDYDALWCAGGLTLAEALCMGVPTAAWGQNERQHQMISDIALSNGCYDLGHGPEADPGATLEALAQWLGPEGQETRQEQTRDGMRLVDGGGAARVAKELWALALGVGVRK